MKHLTSRCMGEHDLAAVMRIETVAYPQPWSEEIFRDCLNADYQCTLYELEGELIGYSIVSLVAGEAHLLNLCMHPAHQGNGYGRAALEQVLKAAEGRQTATVFLEVRVSNTTARRLYESAGFNEIGQRFNYYPTEEGREDALVFARDLVKFSD